jgi:hypothetical protein
VGTDNFVEVAAWSNVEFESLIDWNDAVGGGTNDPDSNIFVNSIISATPNSKGGTLSIFNLSAEGTSEAFPIGLTGSTSEGQYDIYDTGTNTYTITAIPVLT